MPAPPGDWDALDRASNAKPGDWDALGAPVDHSDVDAAGRDPGVRDLDARREEGFQIAGEALGDQMDWAVAGPQRLDVQAAQRLARMKKEGVGPRGGTGSVLLDAAGGASRDFGEMASRAGHTLVNTTINPIYNAVGLPPFEQGKPLVDIPAIHQELEENIAPGVTKRVLGETGAAALKGTEEVAAGFTEPGSVLTLAGISGTAGVAKKLIAAGFSAQMIQGFAQESPEFVAAVNRGDYPEAARIGAHLVATGVMAGLTGQEAVEGVGDKMPGGRDRATKRAMAAMDEAEKANPNAPLNVSTEGAERRSDAANRAFYQRVMTEPITAFSDAELPEAFRIQQELATRHPVTGAKNRNVWDAIEKKPIVAQIDMQGLKLLNDNYSHAVGDEALKMIVSTAREVGLDLYHTGGDEFWTHFDAPEELQKLEDLKAALTGKEIEFEHDGRKETVEGIGIRYGYGPNEETADNHLSEQKRGEVSQSRGSAQGNRPVQGDADHLPGPGEEPAGQDGSALDSDGSKRPPAGVKAGYVVADGQKLSPLEPPDMDLRMRANDLVEGAAGDETMAANYLAHHYGIETPIVVVRDPMQPVAATFKVGDRYEIHLPEDAEPWEILHELAYEVRRGEGKWEAAPDKHDNNAIIGQALGDLRAEGVNVPTTGSRTTITQSDILAIKDSAHRNGFIDPDEIPPSLQAKISAQPLLWQLRQILEEDRGQVGRFPVPGEYQKWSGQPSRLPPELQQGLEYKVMLPALDRLLKEGKRSGGKVGQWIDDAQRWALKSGGQLTEEDLQNFLSENGIKAKTANDILGAIADPERMGIMYEQGDTSFDFRDGDALVKDGQVQAPPDHPEGERLRSDQKILDKAAEQEQTAGGATELHAEIPIIGPFVRHTLAPIGKTLGGAVVDAVTTLGHMIGPTVATPSDILDTISRRLGGISRDRAEFALNKANVQIRRMFDTMTQAENIAFIERFLHGKPQITPELQRVADMIRKADDADYVRIDAEMAQRKGRGVPLTPGLYAPWIENHFAILWDKKPGQLWEEQYGSGSFQRKPLEGTKGALKARTYDSFVAGLFDGGVPKSYNPMILFEMRHLDNTKFIETGQLFRDFKDQGLVEFVKLGGRPSDPNRIPIDDKLSRVYYPANDGQGMIHAGNYYWDPEVARLMNNYLSSAPWKHTNLGKTLFWAKNYQTMVELVGPFHAIVEGTEAIATEMSNFMTRLVNEHSIRNDRGSILGAFTDIAAAPYKTAQVGGSVLRYFIDKNEFLKTARGQDFVKMYPDADRMVSDLFDGGGSIASHEEYRIKALQGITDAYNNGDVAGAVLRSVPGVVHMLTKPIFESYIPRLKLGAFFKDYAARLRENADQLMYDEVSRTALARRSWTRIENRFGEMDFSNLMWNENFKAAMQLTFRSVTWKLGTVRGLTGGILGQVREFAEPAKFISDNVRSRMGMNSAPRGVRLDPDFAWIVGLGLTTGVAGTVLQGIFNDDHKLPWQTDTPLIDFVAPRVGGLNKYGKPNRVMIPSYMRDILSMAHSPSEYLKHGASSLVSKTVDAWQNRDFWGNQVYDPKDPILAEACDVLVHYLPVPFGVSGFQEALKEGQMGGSLALPPLGFQKAPAYLTATPWEQFLQQRASEQGGGGPARTKAQAETAQLRRDLTQEAREHGMETVEDRMQGLSKTMQQKIGRQSSLSIRQARADSLPLLTMLEGWHLMNPDEQKEMMPILQRKANANGARGRIPPDKREAVDKQLREILNLAPMAEEGIL